MRNAHLFVAGVLALALCAAPGVARSDGAEGPATPVPAGTSFTMEFTQSFHHVEHAYFDGGRAADQWAEGFTRVRVNHAGKRGAWFSVGGVALATGGTDYYGQTGGHNAMIDQFVGGMVDIGGTGLNVTVGRQDLLLGDGFLVGDGYRDYQGAEWNIPLNFYDAVKADWKKGPERVTAFAANLSPSLAAPRYGDTKGVMGGIEAGVSPSDAADVAITFLMRNDTGATDNDGQAYSLRGRYARGIATLSGEAVLEGGKIRGTTLAAHGGHLALDLAPKAKYDPHARLEYFLFSGDDTSTPGKSEAYDPWQYRWNDWSNYYVGDVIGSTLLYNTDARIAMLQFGATPRKDTQVRCYALHASLDTGASYGLSGGDGSAFANEFDVVVDQKLAHGWSAWVMGAHVMPLAAAKQALGDRATNQVFASVNWKFGSAGGGGDE